MHRQLLAAALLVIPTFAFGAGQSPAATEKPHPSTRAHANAMAGEAGATRIEACAATANALIDNLEKSDFTEAASNFDATMKANLGADKLGQFWTQVAGQIGTLQSQGAPQNMMHEDHAVITLPLHFEKGDANAQIAGDTYGKVAGFFLRPALAPASSRERQLSRGSR